MNSRFFTPWQRNCATNSGSNCNDCLGDQGRGAGGPHNDVRWKLHLRDNHRLSCYCLYLMIESLTQISRVRQSKESINTLLITLRTTSIKRTCPITHFSVNDVYSLVCFTSTSNNKINYDIGILPKLRGKRKFADKIAQKTTITIRIDIYVFKF